MRIMRISRVTRGLACGGRDRNTPLINHGVPAMIKCYVLKFIIY